MDGYRERELPASPERRDNGILLGLHGLPRAGKDTVAAALIAQGYTRAAFADAVYKEVARAFNVTVEQLRSDEWKTSEIEELRGDACQCMKYRAMLQSMGLDLQRPRPSRLHLRLWATEYRRNLFEQAYWTNEIDFTLSFVRGPVVITDLRFLNEHTYLSHFAWRTNRRLHVVRITRDGTIGGHVSDNVLADRLINLTVHNVEGESSIAIDAVQQYLALHRR